MATYISNITAANVRLLSDLGTADVSDSDVADLLAFAVIQFNHDTHTKWSDWRVIGIDNEKENKVDGSNVTFYVPQYPIGDYNDDGTIGASDIKAYSLTASGTRTTYTVSAITDDSIGKITMTSAPTANETLYLTWSSCPVELSTPHALAKVALIQLCNALMYTKLDAGKLQAYKARHLSVTRPALGYEKHYKDYRRTITQILSKAVKRRDFAINE